MTHDFIFTLAAAVTIVEICSMSTAIQSTLSRESIVSCMHGLATSAAWTGSHPHVGVLKTLDWKLMDMRILWAWGRV